MSLGYDLSRYDPSRVRLGDQPQKQGTNLESRFSGTSCCWYDFAWVRVVQLSYYIWFGKTITRSIYSTFLKFPSQP